MRLKIFLIIFVVLFIIISGVFFLNKARLTSTLPTLSSREGYNQYSDTTYDISFEYPSKWGTVAMNPAQPENIRIPLEYTIGFSGNNKVGIFINKVPWRLLDESFQYRVPSETKSLIEKLDADDKRTLAELTNGDDCAVFLKSRQMSQDSKESCRVVPIENVKAIERYLDIGSLVGSLSIKMYTLYSGNRRYDISLILHHIDNRDTPNGNWEQYSNLLEKTRNSTAPQSVMIAVDEFDEFVQSIRFQSSE